MTTTPYTTTDYLYAIRRELAKRRTAYPKIVAKKEKEWLREAEDRMMTYAEAAQYIEDKMFPIITEQRIQNALLEEAEDYLLEISQPDTNIATSIWRELRRELRMRKRCYPRWVRFRRMDADDAERELQVFTALCDYFHREFCPEAKIRGPRVISH